MFKPFSSLNLNFVILILKQFFALNLQVHQDPLLSHVLNFIITFTTLDTPILSITTHPLSRQKTKVTSCSLQFAIDVSLF